MEGRRYKKPSLRKSLKILSGLSLSGGRFDQIHIGEGGRLAD